MRLLTRILPELSMETIADRIELGFTDSGGMLWKGTTDSRRLRMNWPNSFGRNAYLVKADLWSYTVGLRTAFSNGEKTQPELGFGVLVENCGEEGLKSLGFLLGCRGVLITAEGRRPSSSAFSSR
jgi:hypothetical protein